MKAGGERKSACQVVWWLAICGLMGLGIAAHAGQLTWDANLGAAGAQDGGGIWTATDPNATNWWTGSANVAWNNANNDTAILQNFQGGPRAYVVTNTDPVTIGGLLFLGSFNAYTLAASGSGVLNLAFTNTVISNAVQGIITAPIGGAGGIFFPVCAGTLYLSASNSYTGPTVVNGVSLRLRDYCALGDAAGGTTINGGGQVTWDNGLAGTGTTPDPFFLNGGTLYNSAPNAVTCSGLITVQASSTIGAFSIGGRNTTFTGGITNMGVTLTMDGGGGATFNINSTLSGTGTVNLWNSSYWINNTNTFVGSLIVSNSSAYVYANGGLGGATTRVDYAGIIRVGNNVAPGGAGYVLNGGTLWAWQNNMTLTNPIALTASSTIRSHDFGSSVTLSGDMIALGTNILTLLNATASPGNGNIYAYARITGAGGVVMGNGIDNGTFWFYNASNDYSGATTITSGRLLPQANWVIPSNSDVIVNSQNAQALDLFNNLALTIGSLGGTGVVNTETSGKLTTGYNNNSTAFGGRITGSGSLVKIGSGAQTLSGASTYSGSTLVAGGALLVDGLLSNAVGAVTVTNSGTLGGTGTIARVVTVLSNGAIMAGATGAVGTLTVSTNLSLQEGAVVLCDVIGGNSDRINVGGTLALPTNATVNVSRSGGPGASEVVLFSASALAGATNSVRLTGWTVVAPVAMSARISGTTVVLQAVRGTVLTVH